MTFHTAQAQYRAGESVTVIVQNGTGSLLEFIPGCGDQLERYDGRTWLPMAQVSNRDDGAATDGVQCLNDGVPEPCPLACEEGLRQVERCASLSYRSPLLATLPAGKYRLRVIAKGRQIQYSNVFSVTPRE